MHFLLLLFFLPSFRGDDVKKVSDKPDVRGGFESIKCLDENTLYMVLKNGETTVINCESPTPFCHSEKKECVEELPGNGFYCEADGYFPHLSSCNRYYFCQNGTLFDYQCVGDLKYDIDQQRCRIFGPKETCYRPNCTNKNGVTVKYPKVTTLYVFCKKGFPDSLHTCPEGEIFLPGQTPPCGYLCRNEGYFPDIQNPNKFYHCIFNRFKGFQKSVHFCPDDKIFVPLVEGGPLCKKKQ